MILSHRTYHSYATCFVSTEGNEESRFNSSRLSSMIHTVSIRRRHLDFSVIKEWSFHSERITSMQLVLFLLKVMRSQDSTHLAYPAPCKHRATPPEFQRLVIKDWSFHSERITSMQLVLFLLKETRSQYSTHLAYPAPCKCKHKATPSGFQRYQRLIIFTVNVSPQCNLFRFYWREWGVNVLLISPIIYILHPVSIRRRHLDFSVIKDWSFLSERITSMQLILYGLLQMNLIRLPYRQELLTFGSQTTPHDLPT